MKGVAQPPQYHPEGDVFVHTLLLLRSSLRARQRLSPGERCCTTSASRRPFRVAPDRIRFDGHVEIGVEMAAEICHRCASRTTRPIRFSRSSAIHMRFGQVQRMKAIHAQEVSPLACLR